MHTLGKHYDNSIKYNKTEILINHPPHKHTHFVFSVFQLLTNMLG